MGEFAKGIFSTVGAIIVLAMIAVVISRRSRAPEAIGAISDGLAKVVAAAVNPVATAATNGNPGQSTFTNPAGTLGGSGNLSDWFDSVIGN